ncbi:MAG TPA: hypothetical protein G4O13_08425 [Dehalococcoidia bacterium]|nr:hypothetical protein [Dehalococcoidia bacterium]
MTVSGTGWPQRTPGAVTVTIEGAGTAIKKNATPDSSGAFSISYTAPPTDDAYFQDVGADCDRYLQVWAQDILGNVAPKPTNKRKFCLKAAYLTLDPKSGPPGTSVKVTGAGFQPQTSVEDLKIANTMIFAPNLMTNTVGTFTTTFPAPTLPLGCQVVSATVAGLTLGECFTITEPSLWGALDGELEIPVEDALATISDKLIRVWGYYNGEWRVYDPNDPLGSNLTGLISGRAYWIKLSEDCTLIFRQLKAGWNNIGW